MAFMMPVMKNNYGPLYAAQAATKQQRRTSETDASKRSKSQQIIGATGSRRKVRSEGPSLSTSPGSGGIMVNPQANLQVPGRGSRPMPMQRVRGSAPVLGAHSMPLHRHNSMPHGPNVSGSAPTKPASPTRSDSSSSSSEPASPTVTGKFHLKLIARLRRSLRLKDSTPPTPPPEAAATTA